MGDYLKGETWSSVYKEVLCVGAALDRAGLTATEKEVWTDDGAGSKALAAFKLSTDTLLMTGTNKLAFYDLGIYVNSSADGHLDIVSDGTGFVDAINIESASGITLDAGDSTYGITYEDDGTALLRITQASSDVIFKPLVLNKDIIFQEDSGTEIARFDSSAEALLMADGKEIQFGDTGEKIAGNLTDLTISSGNDINLTATTDINIPANVGLTFGSDNEKIESNGQDFTFSTTGSLILTSSESTDDAIKINTSNAAGGLDIDVGTGGIDILSVNHIDIDTSGAGMNINLDAQLGSILIDGGEAVADAVKITASTNNASTTLNINSAGTGVSAIDVNSLGGFDLDAVGDITIDTTDTTDGIKIGTVTSGVPITIGHTTSEVTVADNLTVSGNATVTGTLTSGSFAPDAITLSHATDPIFTMYNTESAAGDGDGHCTLIFKGKNGSGVVVAQRGKIIVDHPSTGTDEKGDMHFYTNSGSQGTSPGEALRLEADNDALFYGAVSISATNKFYLDGGNNTYIHESAADTVGIVVNANTRLVIDDNSYISLSNNDSGSGNTLMGYNTGSSITTGNGNSLFGHNSGKAITDGRYNSLVGQNSGQSLIGGDYNAAIGYNAGVNMTTGIKNTLIGASAGSSLLTGANNTVMGYFCKVDTTSRSGAIVIGNNHTLQNASDNYVEFGNASNYMGYDLDSGTITITSDRRIKKEITKTGLGLDFINQLNPVRYKMRPNKDFATAFKIDKKHIVDELPKEKQNKIYDGLIAQDVKKVMDDLGIDFSGWTEDRVGRQQLNYNAFIPPLIKAVQELSAQLQAVK